MIESAMDAIVGDSADRFRHAATSARSALESAAIKVTKTREWKVQIRARAPEEVAKLFTVTYQLLSSLTHPGRKANHAMTELAVKNTLNLLVWLVQQAEKETPARN
jgi:hypothetical protein